MYIKKILRKCSFISIIFILASNLAFSNTKKEKVLHAVIDGTEKEIKKQLFAGGYVNASYGENEDNLLLVALKHRRDEKIIALLLKVGVDTTYCNKNGDTPLLYACRYGYSVELAEQIIKKDTRKPLARQNKVLHRNNNKYCSFDYARTDEELLNMLQLYAPLPENFFSDEYLRDLEIEAEPEKPEPVKNDAVPEPIVQKEKPQEIIEENPIPEVTAVPEAAAAAAVVTAEEYNPYRKIYLFEGIDDIEYESDDKDQYKAHITNKADENGRTTLMKAAARDEHIVISALLTDKGIVNETDSDNWTSLMYAARYSKNEATIALLASSGADFSRKNRYGLSAVEIAAAGNKNPEVIKAVALRSSKTDRQKAFITAISLDRGEKIVSALYDKDIDINLIHQGMTPLMMACSTNTKTDTIEFLLKHGADIKIISSEYKKAFDYARENRSLPRNDIYWSLNSESEGKQQ